VADYGSPRTVPDVVMLPVLAEQDFGSYEGKKFYEQPAESNRQAHNDVEGFVDVESKESLARRADSFLDEHLLPIILGVTVHTQQVIAVVSHGIMLSALWKRLLLRLPLHSVTLSTEHAVPHRPSLEHLGGWSNTGYLELYMTQESSQGSALGLDVPVSSLTKPSASSPYTPVVGVDEGDTIMSQTSTAASPTSASGPPTLLVSSDTGGMPGLVKPLHGWKTVIETINGKDHLRTLKRTGGGLGNSRHDPSQRNMDSFFKRQKLD
jgi:hypothetical protein